MTAPLRISAKVEIDATQAVQGGSVAAGAVGTIGQAADTTSEKLDRLRQEAARIGALGSNIRIFPANEEGRALDNLRAKYNPLYATIRTYKQEVIAIRAAHAAGALGIDEMTAAIQRQRQAALASIDALKGRNEAIVNPGRTPAGNGARAFETANITAQFQDIAVTSAMGMSPVQIALQQGTQLASVIGTMERPVAGLLAAFSSLLSMTSLLTIGVVALSAAAIQYFFSSETGGKKLEDLLQQEEDALKRVRDLWGEAADERSRYGRESTGSASFSLEASISALLDRLRKANSSGEIGTAVTSAVSNNLDLTGLTASEFRETSMFKALKIDFEELHQATVAGRPDVLGLVRTIEEVGQSSDNAGIKKMAEEAVAALKPFRDLAEALREAERARLRLFDDRGSTGMLLSQGTTNRDDMGELALYRSRIQKRLEDEQKVFAAEQARMNARSPAERAAAARQAAAAEWRDEGMDERRQRIDLAGRTALLQAEKQLKDAQIERSRARETGLDQQKLELSLIGQTVGEQERLRMELRLTSELRTEAARNGTEVSREELELVRQLAAEHGRLAEQIAARKALTEQSRDLSDLREQLAVAGQAEQVRARVLVHLETERRIREMGLSLGSAEAEQYRRNAAAIASATTELRKQEAAWKEVRGTAEGAIDTLVDRFAEGDVAGGFETIAKDATKTLLQLGVANPLKNEFLGTDYGTMSDVGGLGGLARGLFGGGGMSTASMSVNAAAVTINGGIGAGLGSLLGANDNAAAGSMGAYRDAIAKIESGGNYSALGPLTGSGDRAYGKYQVMGNNIGPWSREALGRTLNPQQFLADPAAQDSIFDHFFGKSISKYGNASDAASVWFTGRPLAQGGGAADVLGTTGVDYVKKFNAALGSVTSTAETATQGLGTFGNGVGQLGQALSTGAQGGSGGGLFNWLGSIFGGGGGVSPLSPSWQANTTFGNFLAGTPGFDKGGATGGSNPSRVAGLVHEQEFVFDAAATARIGVGNLESLRRGRMPGYQRGGLATTKAAYPVVRFGSSSSEGAAVPSVTNVFQNYSSAKMEHVESRADERGNRQEIYVISEMVGTGMSAKGGDGERTLRQRYGVKPRGIAR